MSYNVDSVKNYTVTDIDNNIDYKLSDVFKFYGSDDVVGNACTHLQDGSPLHCAVACACNNEKGWYSEMKPGTDPNSYATASTDLFGHFLGDSGDNGAGLTSAIGPQIVDGRSTSMTLASAPMTPITTKTTASLNRGLSATTSTSATCYKQLCPAGYYTSKPNTSYFEIDTKKVVDLNCYKVIGCKDGFIDVNDSSYENYYPNQQRCASSQGFSCCEQPEIEFKVAITNCKQECSTDWPPSNTCVADETMNYCNLTVTSATIKNIDGTSIDIKSSDILSIETTDVNTYAFSNGNTPDEIVSLPVEVVAGQKSQSDDFGLYYDVVEKVFGYSSHSNTLRITEDWFNNLESGNNAQEDGLYIYQNPSAQTMTLTTVTNQANPFVFKPIFTWKKDTNCGTGYGPSKPNTSFFVTNTSYNGSNYCYRASACHTKAGAYKSVPNPQFFNNVSSYSSGLRCYRANGCATSNGAFAYDSTNNTYFNHISSSASSITCYRATSCKAPYTTDSSGTFVSEASGIRCYEEKDCPDSIYFGLQQNTSTIDVGYSLSKNGVVNNNYYVRQYSGNIKITHRNPSTNTDYSVLSGMSMFMAAEQGVFSIDSEATKLGYPISKINVITGLNSGGTDSVTLEVDNSTGNSTTPYTEVLTADVYSKAKSKSYECELKVGYGVNTACPRGCTLNQPPSDGSNYFTYAVLPHTGDFGSEYTCYCERACLSPAYEATTGENCHTWTGGGTADDLTCCKTQECPSDIYFEISYDVDSSRENVSNISIAKAIIRDGNSKHTGYVSNPRGVGLDLIINWAGGTTSLSGAHDCEFKSTGEIACSLGHTSASNSDGLDNPPFDVKLDFGNGYQSYLNATITHAAGYTSTCNNIPIVVKAVEKSSECPEGYYSTKPDSDYFVYNTSGNCYKPIGCKAGYRTDRTGANTGGAAYHSESSITCYPDTIYVGVYTYCDDTNSSSSKLQDYDSNGYVTGLIEGNLSECSGSSHSGRTCNLAGWVSTAEKSKPYGQLYVHVNTPQQLMKISNSTLYYNFSANLNYRMKCTSNGTSYDCIDDDDTALDTIGVCNTYNSGHSMVYRNISNSLEYTELGSNDLHLCYDVDGDGTIDVNEADGGTDCGSVIGRAFIKVGAYYNSKSGSEFTPIFKKPSTNGSLHHFNKPMGGSSCPDGYSRSKPDTNYFTTESSGGCYKATGCQSPYLNYSSSTNGSYFITSSGNVSCYSHCPSGYFTTGANTNLIYAQTKIPGTSGQSLTCYKPSLCNESKGYYNSASSVPSDYFTQKSLYESGISCYYATDCARFADTSSPSTVYFSVSNKSIRKAGSTSTNLTCYNITECADGAEWCDRFSNPIMCSAGNCRTELNYTCCKKVQVETCPGSGYYSTSGMHVSSVFQYSEYLNNPNCYYATCREQNGYFSSPSTLSGGFSTSTVTDGYTDVTCYYASGCNTTKGYYSSSSSISSTYFTTSYTSSGSVGCYYASGCKPPYTSTSNGSVIAESGSVKCFPKEATFSCPTSIRVTLGMTSSGDSLSYYITPKITGATFGPTNTLPASGNEYSGYIGVTASYYAYKSQVNTTANCSTQQCNTFVGILHEGASFGTVKGGSSGLEIVEGPSLLQGDARCCKTTSIVPKEIISTNGSITIKVGGGINKTCTIDKITCGNCGGGGTIPTPGGGGGTTPDPFLPALPALPAPDIQLPLDP